MDIIALRNDACFNSEHGQPTTVDLGRAYRKEAIVLGLCGNTLLQVTNIEKTGSGIHTTYKYSWTKIGEVENAN